MSPRKKRTAKKSSRAKKPAGKAASRSRSRKSAVKASSSKRSGKTSKSALKGLGTVRRVGKRTWKTLKSTTAQVVEGVKERFGG